jgi:hypothetical protein
MSKNNDKPKTHRFMHSVIVVFAIIALACSAFAIYEIYLLSSIENLIRYIVIATIGFVDLFIILKVRKYLFGKNKKNKKYHRTSFLVFLLIYCLITMAIGGVIYYIYGRITSINKTTVTYTSDLLVMSNNPANTIEDVKNMSLGILKDTKSPEGYIIPQEIIKEHTLQDENEIKEYDDYTSMLVDMYVGELSGMFVSDQYVSMFSGIT